MRGPLFPRWIRAGAAVAALLLLASCGTAPKKAESVTGGKYYLDDGPPESVPDNLAQIPDAVPGDEAFHRFANRPYTVMGRSLGNSSGRGVPRKSRRSE